MEGESFGWGAADGLEDGGKALVQEGEERAASEASRRKATVDEERERLQRLATSMILEEASAQLLAKGHHVLVRPARKLLDHTGVEPGGSRADGQ
jgi:hypothetical protein